MDYQRYQEIYYSQVHRSINPVTAEVREYTSSGTSMRDSFIGDNVTTVKNTWHFRCLYSRNVGKYQREKHGINENVTGIITIPYLEVKNITGLVDFRKSVDPIRLQVTLFDEIYDIESLKELEPFNIGTVKSCIGYIAYLKNIEGR